MEQPERALNLTERQLAVWFNEDGMRVGYGTSTERPVLQMNWQEVEAKIRSQVVNGTYMGANEAYLTDEAERDRIAGHLFFFSGMAWENCRRSLG